MGHNTTASRFEVGNVIVGVHGHFPTKMEAIVSAMNLAKQLETETLPEEEMVTYVYDRMGRNGKKRFRRYNSKGRVLTPQ